MGLDIPGFIHTYNELRTAPSMNASMRIEFMPEEERPSACIGCGKCEQHCPQGIEIRKQLKEAEKELEGSAYKAVCAVASAFGKKK